MKLKSLIQNTNHLEIAEVEIEFIPGIPQIHFLGLPDRIIKESFYRIKSALKNTGYKFPMSSQMIVNIKPNHLRKSSRGVEFAVALGILLKTNQISLESINLDWIIYGELGLDGHVYEPSDLAQELAKFKNETFLSGRQLETKNNLNQNFSNIQRVKNLNNFEVEAPSNKNTDFFVRPNAALKRKFSTEEAEFLFLAATTGLHGLLAGDSGAGKSTLAKSLISFLKKPTDEEVGRWHENWRSLIAPHQSITPAAFLGGGASLYEGEIERVCGGLLVMDELLEFDPEILESLRGPMTGETLRLSRGAVNREIKPDFQVVATTNLCPCGKWTPLNQNLNCRFSRTKCRRYLERFSGPILDRFGLLLFSHKLSARIITGEQILKRILAVQNYNFDYELDHSDHFLIEKFYENLSTRRKQYLEKAATIYALERHIQKQEQNLKKAEVAQALREKQQIGLSSDDYNKAERWVIKPFEQLEKGIS